MVAGMEGIVEAMVVVTMEKDQLNLDMVVMGVAEVIVETIVLMGEVMEVVVDIAEAIALMEGGVVVMEEDMVEAMVVVTMEKDQLNLDMVVLEVVVGMVVAIALMGEVMGVVVDMVEAIALMEGDAVAMEEDMVEVTMEREMLKLNLDMVAMGMVVMEVEVDMGEVMDLDMVAAMEAIL